jgi:hypothetical protein
MSKTKRKTESAVAVGSTRLLARRTITLMEAMRADGWCVVLKCLPPAMPWVIEGARSEYDAPSVSKAIGKGKWACETTDLRWSYQPGKPMRRSEYGMGDEPWDAVQKVWEDIQRANAALSQAATTQKEQHAK